MNWTGTSSPDGSFTTPCIWIVNASANPNSRHASIVCTGRHLPKMSAASAMKPRPAVILRVKSDDWPIERYAPPTPASTPESTTPIYRMRLTRTPAASAASGFSPTDLSLSPNGVEYRTYDVKTTTRSARKEITDTSARLRQPAPTHSHSE